MIHLHDPHAGSTRCKYLHFRNFPIAVKLYTGFFFVFAIMIALSWMTYSNFKTDKQKNTLDVVQRLNSQTVNKMDETVNSLIAMTKVPMIWENGAHSKLFNYIDESNRTGHFDFNFQYALSNEASKYMITNKNVESFVIYNRNGVGIMYIEGKWITDPNVHESNAKTWYDASLRDYKTPIIFPSYRVDNTSVPSKPYYLFGVSRGIYKLESAETIGVVMVTSRMDYLLQLGEEMKSVNNNRVLLLDEKNRIMADKDTANIGKPVSPIIAAKLEDRSSEMSKEIKLDGVTYLFSYATSQLTGWTVVNMIPLNELYKNINHLAMTTFLTTASLLLIMIVFTVFFSRSIVKPVQKLIRLMRLVENGDFNKEITLPQEDEIGQLARTFNHMSGRIQHLINEISLEKITQKEMELQMLKSQINPHFLYNTLESIRMVAESRKAPDAADMAFSLGQLLRYSIGHISDLVSVREEIYHLEQYMLLQKVRFDDVFTISLDIREEMMDMGMLKIILQPLVENAIYHGISNRSSGGIVEVRGYSDGDNLIFEVCDNGQGMAEETAAALNRSFRDPKIRGTGIGLYNVNKRIQLFYGSKYGLEIISTLGVGTNIMVCIPIR
ncbi:sensor histidine kinase [Paenibacillus hexagrammi]|uniref:histidine kinase n=1 Tax=Paenibacillus hexagrammi TaxID=2908839 RepID=A0ABY3SCM9_9BACL|nr:sensor histidine kinase [Paenibacillus sp. YPD9-1]UJF31759.1 sensor histidine kinase [Paenibacillus sp. YPD9-1]